MRLWIAAVALTVGHGVAAPADIALPQANAVFPEPDMASVHLGHKLFFDPILSGNKTVSCATCHHPRFGTSDGVSLGLGDGGEGLGPDRAASASNPPEQRIPRNSPGLFNLGATEFTRFFHDGRLEKDESHASGIRTPLGEDVQHSFVSMSTSPGSFPVLSAQTMFPVLSADEMAGHYSENDVSKAVRQGLLTGPGGAWDILSKRVEAIPEYRADFDTVIGDRPILFADIADAIAEFVAFEWRAENSPFDLHLREGLPLPDAAIRGMNLFYGKAGCVSCHAGQFQTDHDYHAIGMPQIGPGKAARFERHNRDVGRMRVTGDPADAYKFRTPSLRNVGWTAPYGHSGAFATLAEVIRHHLDPERSLRSYDPQVAVLPGPAFDSDFLLMRQSEEVDAIAKVIEVQPMALSGAEIADLVAFLAALTDAESLTGRLGVPKQVPSGLPVDQ